MEPPRKAEVVPRAPLGTTCADDSALMPALNGVHVKGRMLRHQIGTSILSNPLGNYLRSRISISPERRAAESRRCKNLNTHCRDLESGDGSHTTYVSVP